MQSPSQFVKKAEYARMHGWDRSYVTRLAKEQRLVLSEDGALVDWAASDALIGKTSDPSKLGVKDRWAEERRQREVYDVIHPPAEVSRPLATNNAVPPAADDSSFHQARASREFYSGQMVRLEYEWATGLLVSRMRVEDAGDMIGRNLRDRILGAVPRIAPELAALSDAWEVERRLTEALRQVLDDLASYATTIMRDVNNDPARGRLADLGRQGRERYGTDSSEVAAP